MPRDENHNETHDRRGHRSESETVPLDVDDAKNLTYVGGYLLSKGSQRHSCEQCQKVLCKPERNVVYEREMLCALKSYTRVSDLYVGRLLSTRNLS